MLRGTPQQSTFATLRTNGYPALTGTWYHMGPWDNQGGRGFSTVYPPEKGIDLTTSHTGKDNVLLSWKPFPNFKIGAANNLAVYRQNNQACTYLYHVVEVPRDMSLPVSLGSDDTLSVWLNGKQLLAKNVSRGVEPDQDHVILDLKRGKNELLLKICNGSGDFGVYVCPQLPPELSEKLSPKKPAALVVECGEHGVKQDREARTRLQLHSPPGNAFNDWKGKPIQHCWFDKSALRFDVIVPKGTSGMLHLHFADPDDSARRQRLEVAGHNLGEFDNFKGKGEVVVVPISSADAKTGTISVQIDNLNPDMNAVVSTIKFFPDKP